MAFGKRTAGQAPPPYTPPADEPEVIVEAGTVRTRVTNPGAIDRKFIGIAAGVVILSAGAAIAAPSLMSMVGGHNVRPIEQVIAGLDRDGMRAALAHEAFPDDSGRAFMTSLATHFPNQHGRLLDKLADTAAAGGSRDALFSTVNAWSMEFAPGQLEALGRTGAEGFDLTLDIVSDAMEVLEAEAGGCTPQHLESFMRDPSTLVDMTSYGGKLYHTSMRASQSFIELAAKGRNAQPIAKKLTPDDEIALRATFFSLVTDPQVMDAVQAFGAAGAQGQNFGASNLNICKLGRAVIVKFEGLPNPTKARIFATALSGDNAAFFRDGGFDAFGAGFNAGAQLQPGSFGGTQFFP
jgi:hypothetical protein